MKSMITDDLEQCYLCGSKPVAIHHIFNGTANRKKSDKYGLIIPLCPRCHDYIHAHQLQDEVIKRMAQRKFEEVYSHEKFMEEFHKSYI